VTMNVLDAYLERVYALVEEMRERAALVRVYQAPGIPGTGDLPGASDALARLTEGLPIRVGPGASPGLILRSDTFLELGSPEAGSCSLLLATDTTRLVHDGRVTLVGPEVGESAGGSLPFGQVLMLRGAGLGEKDLDELQRLLVVAGQIEGYMVRSAPGNVWSRVSQEAAAKGFSFATLGRALRALVMSGSPAVEAVEVLFVTSGKADLVPLEAAAQQVRKIAREGTRERWKVKGYDIDCANDCSACGDKPVCDDIRSVLKERQHIDESPGGTHAT